MQNKNIDIKRLFQNGHLSAEGIAMWADALIDKCENELADELKEHVDQCPGCKKQILELYGNLKEIEKHNLIPDTSSDNSKVIPINKKFVYGIAAFIIILLSVAAIVYFTNGTKPDNQQLFAEYFEPYPDVITTKGINEDLLSAGMYYYNIAKYDSAVMFYDKILENGTQKPEVLFYKGICFLALGKEEDAILNLSKVVSDNNNPYNKPATWYLALVYLKMGESKNAKRILSNIINSNTVYDKKASAILHKLR
ncbi:MAG: hypothetical protein B6D61_01420 [Bacteroidetes bacterium 4484_249]|nr:MAG: hypothetical protein B6D61_01420 [Bacteroidetes bacterium 4484_249]